MELRGKSILITGGASGIGLSLAGQFINHGCKVIICGRRSTKLVEAKLKFPSIETIVADVEFQEGRRALANTILKNFPQLDILINNAGIQRRIDISTGEEWDLTQSEIAINLHAPIHLSQLLVEHLKSKSSSAIINVTSGLAFAPLSRMPVYCATKAAMHSFTISLRHQLTGTSVRVIEIIPPAVNTDLGGPNLHTFGVDPDIFAKAVVEKIIAGEHEIGYGTAEKSRLVFQPLVDEMFKRMN